MEPTRDDLELTLSELKSSRLEHTLSLMLTEVGIKEVEAKLAKLPKKKNAPKENPYGARGGETTTSTGIG